MEDVPDASKEGTGLTADSTSTAIIVPKVKDTEDQSVHQDDPFTFPDPFAIHDPFTFPDVATILENQDETLVSSGSDIATEGGRRKRGTRKRRGKLW